MAEDTQLEQEAKNALPTGNQEQKEKTKKIGTLESVVNESVHAAGSLFKLGLAGLIPYAQATAFPHLARDTSVLAGSQIAADATTDLKKGKKYTAGNALESSLVGTVITAPVYSIYNFINKIPTDTVLGVAAKAGAWSGLAYPAFLGMYQFTDYIIKNRTFKGVGKYLKENYWTTLKYMWKYILPFSLANIFFVPPFLQIPVGAALQYFFALFGAPKKGEVPEEKKRDKTSYLVAASNAIGKLGYNLFYAPLKAAESLGNAMRELYKKAPAPAAPAAQAAPAQ